MSLLLPLSLLALGAGPLLFRLSGALRTSLAGIDGFVRVAVGGLVLLHVAPDAWQTGGWPMIVLFLAGMLLPLLVHRLLHRAPRRTLNAELFLGVAALGLHAFLDMAALQDHDGSGAGDFNTSMLGLAVLLHRLPEGLGVWWLVRPRYGRNVAVAVLALMAAATVAGSVFANAELVQSGSLWIAAFQSLVAGALFHVVTGHTFQLGSAELHERARRVSGIGGLLGVALLVLLTRLHSRAEGELPAAPALDAFLYLAAESAPALLLASLTIMLTKALLPGSMLGFFRGRSRFSQALRGTVAGLPVPICSCGVIPMYRGLVQTGVPAAAALSFLVAAPEVGWSSLLLSFGLLGTELTLLRLAGAALLALSVGMLVSALAERHQKTIPLPPEPPAATLRQRLRGGFAYGFGKVVDDTAPWIVTGLLVAAILQQVLDTAWLAALPAGADVLLATLIGMPLYVCASGSTPLVAVLLFKGLSPGAALAFLLTGPATNFTTAGVLSQMHSKKVALAFAAVMAVTATLFGLLVNALLGGARFSGEPPHLHEHLSPASWLALAVLGAVYLAALLRLGVPGFLAQVIQPQRGEPQPGGPEPHDHDASDRPQPPSCCAAQAI